MRHSSHQCIGCESNARAEVCDSITSCTRPHNGMVGAGDGSGSADMDRIDPIVGEIEVD